MRLDFETILGIIFFVVFFILPVFNRKKKAEGEGAPPPKAAGQPQGPGAPPSASTRSAQRQATAQSAPPPASQPAASSRQQRPVTASTIDEALEEIRARVREAQQHEGARRGAGQAPARQQAGGRPAAAQGSGRGSLVSASPSTIGGASQGASGGSLVSAPARNIASTGSATPPSTLGREGPVSRARETVSAPLEVTRIAKGRALEEGKALRALRARQSKASRRGEEAVMSKGRAALATNSNALITGMIWREVLSEPVATRRLRRPRSRQARP